MSCCRKYNSVFRYKDHSVDVEAIGRVVTDMKQKTPEPRSGPAEPTEQKRLMASFSTEIKEEALFPCEHRTPRGTTKIGSRHMVVYNCAMYGFAVNRKHCLECPFVDKQKR